MKTGVFKNEVFIRVYQTYKKYAKRIKHFSTSFTILFYFREEIVKLRFVLQAKGYQPQVLAMLSYLMSSSHLCFVTFQKKRQAENRSC